MATGRIGVTPTLGVRWSKAPAAGTTSLSGLDDNSVSLVYSVGYEQVYRNGVLLSRGNDYTATNGTTVTLTDATVNGDIIEIFANELVPLADAISKGQFTAKGSLLSASAASTPAVLAVGSNDQVLTADSSTTTGLKWATPSAGGMTLISTTTMSGSSITLSSIPQTYNHLQLVIRNFLPSVGNQLRLRINADATANRHFGGSGFTDGFTPAAPNVTQITISENGNTTTATAGLIIVNLFDYTNTTTWKTLYAFSNANDVTTATSNAFTFRFGSINQTSAITSLLFNMSSGNFTSGTILLYGVK